MLGIREHLVLPTGCRQRDLSSLGGAIEVNIAADNLVTLSPQLFVDLALGLDSLQAIATRYGGTLEQLQDLMAHPVIADRISHTRNELQKEGTTARWKARLAAEDLLRDLYLRAKTTDSLSQLNEAVKTLAKIGDLEPKNQPQTIVPFQIIFHGMGEGQAGITIEQGPDLNLIHQAARSLPAEIIRTRNADLAYAERG